MVQAQANELREFLFSGGNCVCVTNHISVEMKIMRTNHVSIDGRVVHCQSQHLVYRRPNIVDIICGILSTIVCACFSFQLPHQSFAIGNESVNFSD